MNGGEGQLLGATELKIWGEGETRHFTTKRGLENAEGPGY